MVNGQDLSGASHEEAIKVFEAAKEPIEVQVVRRRSSEQTTTADGCRQQANMSSSSPPTSDTLRSTKDDSSPSPPPTPPQILTSSNDVSTQTEWQAGWMYPPTSDPNSFDPTDGLDPEKYGWKMENGCLVPDWFDGPVIPADLFHDKEDTDVDTGDQQAVDDAEYDDGSSTDSEWSDDSVESDSD
ncbi:E3 ubiquitin-protein ligase PDZRN3 [Nymphon striatum]|nr:E3 ubiquitin-protein ligase PDZRN3 [Nymphon striatum]